MMRGILETLWLILVAGVASGEDRNGYSLEALSKRTMVQQEITTSWTNFYFTNEGSYGFPTFFFNGNAGDQIVIVDYFCCGDTFTAYFDIPSIPLFVGFNTSDPATVSCGTYQLSPDLAYLFGQFSRLSYTLPENYFINITIVSRTSPFSAGAGAIKYFAAP